MKRKIAAAAAAPDEPTAVPEAMAADLARAFRRPDALVAAAADLRAALSASKWKAQYNALQVLQRQLMEECTFDAANAAADDNRYCDVLPYDHTRVRVTTAAGSDYINASTVTKNAAWRDADALTACQYIAAQAPLPHTCAAFWRMVVEQRTPVVVMLTELVENQRKKGDPYFAPEAGRSVAFGDITVRTLAVRLEAPGLVRRTIEVAGAVPGAAAWTVDHLHYKAWPDHGVPRSATGILTICALLKETPRQKEEQRQQQPAPNAFSSGALQLEPSASPITSISEGRAERQSLGPIVVHCSAGIGRSGVFCAVDMAAKRLAAAGAKEGGKDVKAARRAVDMGAIVAGLRRQRAGMVQTPEQFAFCHKAVAELAEAAAELVGRAD